MKRQRQVLCVLLATLTLAGSAFVMFSPSVAAASRTWTTDTDFNAAGAGFTATEVVGTGVAASVQLLKDTVDWVNRTPASPPSPRSAPGLAFSTSGNLAFLFGGYDGTDLDDTWEYSFATNTWTQDTGNPHPPGREAPGFSYDPVQNAVVLFGGFNTSNPNVYLNDTWEFDVPTKTWTQITPPSSPGLMVDSPLVYDSLAARHILVGSNATTANVETWAYDAASGLWSRLTTIGVGQRTSFALAYDVQRQRTVLFGGFIPLPFPGMAKGDTWEYNYATNTWLRTLPDGSGPSARSYAAMTYRPSDHALLLFGGGSPPQGDTWRYLPTPSWQMLPTLTSPPSRNHAGLVYDIQDDVAILFGGMDSSSSPLGDTWTMGLAYRSAGRYTSSVLNSGGANVDWQWLFWNRTTQPPLTFLRFQLASSTIPNPSTWNWVGPDGTPFTYYNSPPAIPPQAIQGHDNEKYMRFLADFGSTDPQASPVLEDLTIIYNVPPAPPYIVSTDPVTFTPDVPLDHVIQIVFSESMNPGSVNWTFLRGTPVTFTKVWNIDNSILNLTHSTAFAENQIYQIRIDGNDLDGNPLVPGPVPNPMLFATAKYPPYIQNTNPPANQMDVPLASAITVQFNESMNTSTLRWTIDPFVDLTPAWNAPTNNLVTLSHSTPFTQCTEYTVNITQANDTANLPLRPGPAPNPWTFTSLCINPYVTSTFPQNLRGQIALTSAVYVNFSKSMSRSNTSFTIVPDVAGKTFTWQNNDKTLVMTHTSAFTGCTPYTVTASGTDTFGNPLFAGPPSAAKNPFKFETVCSSPYMIATRPGDGETNVSLNTVILIAFSEAMDAATVQFQIAPNNVLILNITWRFQMEMDISHTPFTECTQYTVQITAGRSVAGFPLVNGLAPNPWSFSTICVSPYITSTDPKDSDTLVPLAKPIVVQFSEPMAPPTVVVNPTPNIALTRTWSNNNQTLTLTHTTDFQNCTAYSIFVDGNGEDGHALLIPGPRVPDPWSFTTFCIVSFPYITRTDPANNQQNVPVTSPVVVEFSEQIDTTSFRISFAPTVAGISPSWSPGNTVVTVSHNAFVACTVYTATVSAKDPQGNNLGNVTGSKPNPWTFKSACAALPGPPGLQVIRVPSSDVRLSWRAVTGATSYVIYSSTNRFAAWPWPVRTEVTTTTVLLPGDLVEPSARYYIVRGKDSSGGLGLNSTMGAKVPLTFTFTSGRSSSYWLSFPYRTMYRRASDISDELGATRIDVVAKWDPLKQTSILWYLFRGQWRGSNFPINPGDGIWIGVRSGFTWVVNGTDGAVPLVFTLNPSPSNNVNWISLPYTSSYRSASDIVLDLEGSLGPGANTKIIEVAKWDGTTQTLVRYYWTTTGWTGSNFSIASGEGVYLKIVASFAWTPKLITPEVP